MPMASSIASWVLSSSWAMLREGFGEPLYRPQGVGVSDSGQIYVLDAGKGPHGMDELSRRHLGHSPISFGDVAGTGRPSM